MKFEPRRKAQQAFEEANLVLGTKAPFKEAFPEVEECLVEYVESRRGVQDYEREHRRGLINPGEYVNCGNQLCNGGFNIGPVVREMVAKKETFQEGSLYCRGREGSPKGRRVYGYCNHHLDYKITIKYRESHVKPATTGWGGLSKVCAGGAAREFLLIFYCPPYPPCLLIVPSAFKHRA
jgi:hypothetical protein